MKIPFTILDHVRPSRQLYINLLAILTASISVWGWYSNQSSADEPDLYPKMSRDPNLKIQMEEPFTISSSQVNEGKHEQPHLWRLEDGTLLCDYHWDVDIHFARRFSLRSIDHGKTWEPDTQRVWREEAVASIQGGQTVLSIDTYAIRCLDGKIHGSLCRSTDGGKTFGASEDLLIDMPNAVGERLTNDVPKWYSTAKREGTVVGAFWRSVIELKNGTLLATMQTRFQGDKKLRVVVLESNDQGHHWRYLSTIAADEAVPTEGFCEPVMVQTPNKDLLCVIRTDGFQPLVMARSTDEGKTWSKYAPTGVMGVDPDLAVLNNGVIACSFGRPNVYIMFSTDDGHHWGNVTPIYTYNNSSIGASQWSFGYTGLRQVAPNTLLLIWDQAGWQENANSQPATAVRGVFIHVNRQKQ